MSSSNKTLFNSDAVQERFAEEFRKEMLEAAEPIVEEAIARVRIELRKRVAQLAVGLVESSYNLEQDGRMLRITVQLKEQDAKAKK